MEKIVLFFHCNQPLFDCDVRRVWGLVLDIDMVAIRLKKGTKVEIFMSKNFAWQSAEIISGNGCTYIVKYDNHQRGMSMVTEEVPRMVIRPLPPSMDGMVYWSSGDVVEVLEIYSWKVALVLGVAAGDCYFVKILGSSKDIIAHQSKLRAQHAWKGDHWVIKDGTRFKDGNMVRRSVVEEDVNSPVPQPSQEPKNHQLEEQVPYKDHPGFEEGQRKRRHIDSTPLNLCTHDWDHTEHNDA